MSDRMMFSVHVPPAGPDLEAALSHDGKTPEQFEQEVVQLLQAWCAQHRGRVLRCLVQALQQRLQVTIATPDAYDFPLGERIANLECAIARRGWSIGILQLPGDPNEREMQLFGSLAADDLLHD